MASRFPRLQLLSKGRLVICFFRGRWDPFCCGQLEAMNRILPEIEGTGASLVAISPQTVKHSFFMADQHKLRFRLLSDAGNQVARQFGLVYRVPDGQQAIYRRSFINLPFTNGDESWELPIPGTYILESDSDGSLCLGQRRLYRSARACGDCGAVAMKSIGLIVLFPLVSVIILSLYAAGGASRVAAVVLLVASVVLRDRWTLSKKTFKCGSIDRL